MRRKCASGKRMEMKRQKVGSKDVGATTAQRRGMLACRRGGETEIAGGESFHMMLSLFSARKKKKKNIAHLVRHIFFLNYAI